MTITRASNKLRLSIRTVVNGTNGNWGTARKRSSSTASSRCAEKKCGLGWKPVGHARWFERLLTEVQFELWIGDAAEIRTKRVRKQKTDRQDAELLLRLLIEDRFPRIWVADGENRDLRQLLWHRHRMVQMRTRIMNQLHVLALNEGVRRKKAAAMRTSHCPAEGATTWPRTRTVRGNTPATSSATTSTAKPDLNEWVRAA